MNSRIQNDPQNQRAVLLRRTETSRVWVGLALRAIVPGWLAWVSPQRTFL